MEFLQQQASVRPIPEKVEVDDMTLPQHYLKGTRMCYTKIDGLQGVVVEIILGRPLFSTFLTVSSTNLLSTNPQKITFHAGLSSHWDAYLREPHDEQIRGPILRHGHSNPFDSHACSGYIVSWFTPLLPPLFVIVVGI